MSHFDVDFVRYNKNAINGSRRLRDAILKSLGHEVPRRSRKPAVVMFPVAPHASLGRPKGSPNKARIETEKLDRIQVIVSKTCRIRIEKLRGTCHRPRFSHPRQVAMYAARHILGISYSAIARHFERDHTTVIHACQEVQKRIDAGHYLTIKAMNRAIAEIHPHYPQSETSFSLSGEPADARIAA